MGGTWPSSLTTKALGHKVQLEAATDFLTYMASADGQVRYTDVRGNVPARLDLMAEPKYAEDKTLQWTSKFANDSYCPFWCDELAERQCCIDMFDSVVIAGADLMDALDEGAACCQEIRDDFFKTW